MAIKLYGIRDANSGRKGTITLPVGTYFMFQRSIRENENEDMAMLRIIRERGHYKKWFWITMGAWIIATIIGMAVLP